ncbi:MAG: diaminopimelate decarboxylase [Thermoanaerobaculia bacterium]
MAGFFRDDAGNLTCDGVPLASIAEGAGTPVYVYSRALVEENYLRFDRALSAVPHLVCYATKANSNLAVLRALAALGAGADVVSGGELRAAVESGIPPGRIVFSGVGKTDEEIRFGVGPGLLAFNAESRREIEKIDEAAAALGKTARVALRVNPDIDPRSHPYISTGLKHNKFGIDIHEALDSYEGARRLSHVRMTGIQAHIGSQIGDPAPLAETARELALLASQLLERGFALETLDVGGGIGIGESGSAALSPEEYARAVLAPLHGLPLTILVEPGRAIVGAAGALVTRVLYRKANGGKEFVIVDAGMNDLLRPPLYGAIHPIESVAPPTGRPLVADVVGPICETSDFFARDRALPEIQEGDLLAILDSGAYGFAMSSNYNFRNRAAEVLVQSNGFEIVRRRETFEDLVRLERE